MMKREYTPEQQAFIDQHPHRDPTVFPEVWTPEGYLKCLPGVARVEKGEHVAVKIASVHKSTPYYEVIHSKDLEHIGGHDWELFTVSHIGMIGDQVYIWGMFVEGLGAFNQMVPIHHMRKLLPQEREAWSKKRLGLYGSHSGNLSYTVDAGVKSEG